ncbi:MAG TPA: hypothetical protein VHY37_14425, partial [Tepidisphaeraceae bacterium]|nr:hypothetical protein [Tepidisphaeraceae bacterium]
LIRAYVVFLIGSKTDFYTCGMHLLGAPDLIMAQLTGQSKNESDGSSVGIAAELFKTFALYLLAECKVGGFISGHTFRIDKDAPRYRVVWEPCSGYPEDSFFFNPFGRWRFAGVTESPEGT